MEIFRKKYLYNPQNPIYVTDTVKTYNCLNTETKDNRLALIHHLKEAPFVEPSSATLQPIEIPTMSQPFSVYPLVYCVSQIGKLSEPEAMYVLKCLLECKLKNPLYYVVSPQGICGSQIEGLLPNRSPSLFNLALDLLDIPENLTQADKSVVSKEGYAIVKGIRDGENVLNSINAYGWKDVKKQKDNPKDSEYWVFKGRRKQQGAINDQYAVAWHPKHGMCRMKYIDLSQDSYQTQFYKDFADKVSFYQENTDKRISTIQIHKCVKQGNGIKIFTQIPNQGCLSEYISKKQKQEKTLTENNFIGQMEAFVDMMKLIKEAGRIKGHAAMHIKSLFVHNNRIVLGEPLLITDKVEKRMRELKNSLDYYAPQMKQNIILPENLFKLDFERMDIWSFGFILHKIYTREVPLFDPARKPMLSKEKLSPGMCDLINRCLSLTPNFRPTWNQINLRELQKAIIIQQVEEVHQDRIEIRLGPRNQKKMRESSNKFSMHEENIQLDMPASPAKLRDMQFYHEQKQERIEEEQMPAPLPIQLSSRLKKVKLVTKIILIVLLYIFVFFRPFLGNSIDIILVRSFYGTTSLHLIDHSGSRLSTTTVITNDPNFFVLNDISFIDLQNVYRCIPNNFDPVYNPNYSLLGYIQSSNFMALLLTGWLFVILICGTKAIQIWRGGISNRPTKNICRHWAVYGFFEVCMASVLFAHFYIYEFFYFAGASPCLNIQRYSGLDPYFDSSLYLMLSNENGYFQKVFSTLGVLSCLILLSSCFYAWGPKLDSKYILSVVSIILRFVPFVLFLLICRVGVFYLFSPTAINDSTSILPAIVMGSIAGFFGIIPQVFILICILVEVLLELFFYWCERKASESDRMAKFFNIRRKKITNLDDGLGVNDMSIIDNSKHHLDIGDVN